MTEMPADSAWRARLRVILAASVGSALEWYDFFLYGTAAALVFGDLFFPKSDPVVGTLLAFLTFGVGFVVRPLGGIPFGIMGDRFGRKPVLVADSGRHLRSAAGGGNAGLHEGRGRPRQGRAQSRDAGAAQASPKFPGGAGGSHG
jgi:Sugar (and other) transporter